jgi:hypothetical protein
MANEEHTLRQFNPADIPVTNPAEISSVYANNITIFSAPHDVRLVFTEIVNQGIKDDPAQELRASVAISHTQAALLIKSLSASLERVKTAPKVV